jgi:hypothetical protein
MMARYNRYEGDPSSFKPIPVQIHFSSVSVQPSCDAHSLIENNRYSD